MPQGANSRESEPNILFATPNMGLAYPLVKHHVLVYSEPEEDGAMTTPMGDKIKRLRKKKGMTLDGLAKESGSSKSYIWELENDNPPRPSAEKISAIASALGVTTDYLIDAKGDIPEASAIDEAFFREYRNMPEETKEKIRQTIHLWKDDG